MRKPRLLFPGGLYHVIARGNQRQRTFLIPSDYQKYLKILGSWLIGLEIKLYAYCLMPNHLHLLMEQAGDYPLSRFMQRLQTAYTQYFNRKHRKIGHLFQGRYKAILVNRDSYLLELIRYIHLNPTRAKLEEKPGKYPWTSHAQYLDKAKDPLAKVEKETILRMFGKKRKAAIREYVRFVLDDLQEGHRDDLYDLRQGHILGDEKFEEEAYQKAKKPDEKISIKIKKSLPAIWKALLAKEHLETEPEGRLRSSLLEKVAYLATEGGGIGQREVGEFFGIEQSGVSRAIRRLEEKWKEDPGEKEKWMQWARGLEKS